MRIRLSLTALAILGTAGAGFLLGAAPATVPATGAASPIAPAPAPLDVTSLKPEIALSTPTAAPGQEVKATFRVRDVGTATQHVGVMSCSWPDDWKTDSSSITVAMWDCAKNILVHETLTPGAKFEREGSYFVDAKAAPGVLTFKCGYTPEGSKETVWSDPVTLTIKPAATQPG